MLPILLVATLVAAPAIPLLSQLTHDTNSVPSPISEELTETSAARKSVATPYSVLLIFQAETPLHDPLIACGESSDEAIRLDSDLCCDSYFGRGPSG